MIIKRWNGTAFVEEHPKTKAQLIFNNTNDTAIFDGNDKIKPAFLPDAVFDSLYFFTTAGATPPTVVNLTLLASEAFIDAASINRSPLGYYWIQNSATGSLFAANPTGTELVAGKYYKTIWQPAEETEVSPITSVRLEQGDWFVITKIQGGDGSTSANAIIVTFAVVNNTYELASTTVDGIVRLSSRATYAALSGNNVVTESVLKTVIDNAAFAASNHAHGNITNAGAIGSTALLPIITTTGGVLTTSTFGTAAGTFAQGNDARLSDARTPLAHVHGNISNTGAIGTTANLPLITTTSGVVTTGSFGTTANTFTQGNDSRLSDARTPLSHTHGNISNTGIATNTDFSPGSGAKIMISDSTNTIGKSNITFLGSGTGFLRQDGSWETPAGTFVHPTQTAIDVNATDNGINVIDRVQVNTLGHVTAVSTRNLSNATTAAPGVMSAADKIKLDGISARALGGLSVTSNQFEMVHPFFVQAATPATPLTGTVWLDIN
jgi:hypothetical protein